MKKFCFSCWVNFLTILLKSASNSSLTFPARKKLDTTTVIAHLCIGYLSNFLLWQEVSEACHTLITLWIQVVLRRQVNVCETRAHSALTLWNAWSKARTSISAVHGSLHTDALAYLNHQAKHVAWQYSRCIESLSVFLWQKTVHY